MLHKIEKKIDRLKYYLKLLNDLKKDCNEKIINDPIYEGALLHYLYLISDGAVALAEMVIKYKSLPSAQSYYEAIDKLGEYDILPKEFAYNFAKIASFRNFLAHDYEKIDYLLICNEILDKLDDIQKYLKFIEKAI